MRVGAPSFVQALAVAALAAGAAEDHGACAEEQGGDAGEGETAGAGGTGAPARPGWVELGAVACVVAGGVVAGWVAGGAAAGGVVTGGVVPGSAWVGSTVMVALEEAESVCTPAKAELLHTGRTVGVHPRAQPPSTGAEPVAVTTTSPERCRTEPRPRPRHRRRRR